MFVGLRAFSVGIIGVCYRNGNSVFYIIEYIFPEDVNVLASENQS